MKKTVVVLFGLGLLGGCQPPPTPPPENLVARGMAEALIDTGLYSEVAVTRIIGSHYNPSTASWKIFACFQFAGPAGQQGTNCMDSFEALRLDSNDWVISATVDGVYRWRAINSLGIEPARVDPAAPAAGPATNPVSAAPTVPAPAPVPSAQPHSGTSSLNETESESRSSDQAR